MFSWLPGALVPKRSDSPATKHDQGKITDQNALNNKYFQGDEKGSVCKKLLIQWKTISRYHWTHKTVNEC